MPSQHTVKAFDKDLEKLVSRIAEMGGLAEANLASAIQSVVRRDSELAHRTVEADRKIDALEKDVDEAVVRLIALRQPVAGDLRLAIAALRIAGEIERIGDYAANVAKRAVALNQQPLVRPVHMIPRIGELVQAMIKDTLDAYVNRDLEKAQSVWKRDGEVDELYNSAFRELLTYMMEDPRSITVCTHLLFMAKNIERIGDHATNIAELIQFSILGAVPEGDRPKQDNTAYQVMEGTPGK